MRGYPRKEKFGERRSGLSERRKQVELSVVLGGQSSLTALCKRDIHILASRTIAVRALSAP